MKILKYRTCIRYIKAIASYSMDKDINKENLEDALLHILLNDVAIACNTSVSDIKSKKRTDKLSNVRSIFCYMARKRTTASVTKIGNVIKRDHSTVSFSINKCKESKKLMSLVKKFDKIF